MDRKAAKELLHIHAWLARCHDIVAPRQGRLPRR